MSVRRVIYSHGHRDHASGAGALGDVREILAHERTAGDIAVREYDDVLPPTITFDEDTHTLTVGSEQARLIRLYGAHTDALVITYFRSTLTGD